MDFRLRLQTVTPQGDARRRRAILPVFSAFFVAVVVQEVRYAWDVMRGTPQLRVQTLRSGSMGLCVSMLAFVFAVCISAAQAQTNPARASSLSWVRDPGAESCISTQALARAIEQRVGPTFVSASEAEISIEASVEPAAGGAGWNARVVVSDPSGKVLGTRLLNTSESQCSALDEQLILVIAVAVDRRLALAVLPRALNVIFDDTEDPAASLLDELRRSDELSRSDEVSPSEGKESKPAADAGNQEPGIRGAAHEPTDNTHSSEPAVPSDESRWTTAVEASAALGTGILPNLSVALGIGAELAPPGFWPMALHARLWLPNERRSDYSHEGVTYESAVQVISAQLGFDLCPLHWRMANWTQLRAWAGLWSGLLHGKGSDFAASNDNAVRWQFGSTFHLSWLIVSVPFRTEFSAGVQVPFYHPSFQYIDAAGQKQDGFQVPAAGGWGQLEVGFQM